jgi:cytochrome c
MRTYFYCLAIVLLSGITLLSGCSKKPRKIMVFIGTAGDASSASTGVQAILKLGKDNDFTVDTTSDAGWFLEDTLKNYSAIAFLNTGGGSLNNYQQADLERYIQAGGGYVGIHAATGVNDWGWYGRLTGGANHPRAFQHDFDGGRVWYTDSEAYGNSGYMKHLLSGIDYAIGDNSLHYNKATTLRVPEEDRFTKTPLIQGVFTEPTEMTILPNLDILVAQRRGEILIYKHDTKTIEQAGLLDVYWKTLHTPGVNAEEGLLGIQADPDFADNHYIYVFYSPADTSVNRLSRFTLTNDRIAPSTEKILFQFYAQREICCHTGGSIAFGQDHNLFVSTGDNSTPFDEPNTPYASHGYAPLDDRPGHIQYDSRRTAGNSNDLRGKILRIRVKSDGSYEIPDGNLFPKGEPLTRPEIYVMGDRNPYRISVDKKNGYLYWGEVGPDAGQDSLDTRGPRGYDEINQARKAGYFGWPLFVGDNYPYHRHDYGTNTNGPAFDPAKPVNDSRNNTGLRDLPPAQPAFIWYPYAESPEFPQLGSGGRCAMAGPVFYSDLYPQETRMPDYYNGKLFMYDWTRGWFKVVTMRSNGDFDKMEPFMEHTHFNAPIDVEMGPDGRLYILEYGNGWFTKNADDGIFRIDYNGGNRPPHIDRISVSKTSGSLPLNVIVRVSATDPENDYLSYVYDMGDGHRIETQARSIHYSYTTPGDFSVSVEAKDAENDPVKSESVKLYAGNEVPTVHVRVQGNQTFYFPGTPVHYAVDVRQEEDPGSTADTNNLVVSANYREGTGQAEVPQGDQQLSIVVEGKNLMLSQDCKTCHKVNEKSIGPAFEEVAKRYQKDPGMVSYLVQKVTKGGSGKWGDVAMPAHPSLKEADLRKIIGWIQTLSGAAKLTKSLPAKGTVDPTMHQPPKDNGILVIAASYTNEGGQQVKPLTGSGAVSLKNSRMTFAKAGDMGTQLSRQAMDLSTVTSVEMGIQRTTQAAEGNAFELHLDSAAGRKIGTFDFARVIKATDKELFTQTVKASIDPVTDGKMHHLYIVPASRAADLSAEPIPAAYIQFFNK